MRTGPTALPVPSAPHSGRLPPGHPPTGGRPRDGGATGAAATSAPVELSPAEVETRLAARGLAVTFPDGWRFEEGAASQFVRRIATIWLPAASEGGEDGELSIIASQGSVEANVRRWEGQFKEGQPAKVSTRSGDDGLKVTTVELEGTFSSGGGPMMRGGPPKPGTKLFGVIVERDGSPEKLFFKAWGNGETMAAREGELIEFAASIRSNR